MDLHICAGCGARSDAPVLDGGATGPALACAECGHRQPFRRLPLFALTGPSGGGKSTVGRRLVAELAGRAVVLEQDVLWMAGLQDPDGDYRQFRSTWLRMAAMIHQSGRPVVLCGTVVPVQFELRPQRVFFSRIHYLGLVCDPAVLRERLRARPAWRGWDEPRIEETLRFNDWLRHKAAATDPPIELLDTTGRPLEDTVAAVLAWLGRAGGPLGDQ